jgi:hypothetical protein
LSKDSRVGPFGFKRWTENRFVEECAQLIEVATAIGNTTAADEIRKRALGVIDDPRLQGWKIGGEQNKPPELAVLGRFVGTWDGEVVTKPAVWTPKEVRENIVEVHEMVLDGWYLQGRAMTPEGEMRAILMSTYDPIKRTYRIWRFSPGGLGEELTGQWDEATATLTIPTDLGNKINSATTFHLIDKDHHDFHTLAKDSDGKVYLDIQGTLARRK